MLSPRSRRKNLARPQSKPARYWLHNSGWANTSTDPLSSANGNVFSEAVWVQTGRPGSVEHTGDNNPLFLSGSWAPPTLSNKWPHIWGAHLHLRHLEAGRCWQDWTIDAECSVVRNKLESTVPAEKSHSVTTAHMSREWGSEERSRGKKTSEQVSTDLILSKVNC